MQQRTGPWVDTLAVALIILMGIHTVRTYLAMAGWMLGTGLTVIQLGLLLLSIWGTGLLTVWGSGLLGRRIARLAGRPLLFFAALLFGSLYVLYRAVPGPYTSPVVGCLSVIAWLWLLPTALWEVSRRATGQQILTGFLIGTAGQVALQTGLHGMDLVLLLGPGPGAVALVLVVTLLILLRLGAGGEQEQREPGEPVPTCGAGWGLVAWGPYLALQMTLLSNLGWIQWFSGWQLQQASGLVLAGSGLAAAFSPLKIPRMGRVLAAVTLVIALINPQSLAGRGIWILPAVQVLLALVMVPAFETRPQNQKDRGHLWVGLGSVLAILLILLFYALNEWKLVWPIMAGLAALPGLFNPRTSPAPQGRSYLGPVTVFLLGTVTLPLSLIPRSGDRPYKNPAPAELTVMTYNVHQLFNWRGVPGPEAIARVIEESGADLIGLQETGRGWDFTGGSDMVSWLRWRFPGYHVRYGKTEGDLVGNILLSRYPILATDWTLYKMKGSPFQRGYIWVQIPTEKGDLLFLNTHLSAWRNEEPDRISQVEQLLSFWARQERFLMLGDLNARPDSEPIRLLKQGGLLDLTEPLGMNLAPTFPAANPRIRLDHVFASRDVEPVRATIPESLASDHRPLVVRLRIR